MQGLIKASEVVIPLCLLQPRVHNLWDIMSGKETTLKLKDIPYLEEGWPYKMLTTIQMKCTKRSSLVSMRAGLDPMASGKRLRMQLVQWELGI